MDTPAAPPSDSPVTTPPPRDKWEQLQAVFGNLARPYAIWISASSAAAGTVICAVNAKDLTGAGFFIAAAWAGVAALAGVRAAENVKVAQAQASTPAVAAAKGPPE